MAESSRIVPIGAGSGEPIDPSPAETARADEVLMLDEADAVEIAAPDAARPRPNWARTAVAVLAIAAVLAWTGLFAWVNRTAMTSGGTPELWAQWLVQWSSPSLLIGVAWLIAMRNSTREAARFGAAARTLSDESQRLEARLLTVNRELSLAREFIASQSRDIESLGRVATERLSQHAERLAELVQENGNRVDAIGTVSETALENMEKLRGQLPVIASSAKDVTNNIGNAGRTAHSQIETLVSAFNRLNEFGEASKLQVTDVRAAVDEAMDELSVRADHLARLADERFAELGRRSEEFRARLDSDEVDALASIRTRASALGEELAEVRAALDTSEAESLESLRARLVAVRDESAAIVRSVRTGENDALQAWRGAIERLDGELHSAIARVEEIDRKAHEAAQLRLREIATEAETVDARLAERDRLFTSEMQRRHADVAMREAAALNSLSDQLAGFDASIAERRAAQLEHAQSLISHGETIEAQLGEFAARMDAIAARGGEAETRIGASLATLAERLVESRNALAGTDKAITELTDGSVRLLELIRAGVQHSSEDLPKAIAEGESRLEVVEQRALMLRDTVREVEGRGKSLSDYVLATREELDAARIQIAGLQTEFGEQSQRHVATLAELRGSLAAAQQENDELARRTQAELRTAIDALVTASHDAVAGIESMSGTAVEDLAQRLGSAGAEAIDKAMRERVSEIAEQLQASTTQAAGVSREAAIQLRDQLAKVNELAGNLEQRVERARRRAEEQVDGDFARRVALITEALNSNAIDIAKAMATDIADTAWSAYLRGDRGVFTRRAVRLLDSAEAKSVAQVYEEDRDFREHVSRYIHDFEAMLRQLLSTRDGHALGVTILSSDMGKLYVALAQSIERFRD